MSLVSILISNTADYLSGKHYHNYLVTSWNTGIHFAFFIIVVILLSRLRIYMDERTDLIIELQGTLADANELSGILPICSSCKKIRNDEGYWQHVEEYISRHSNAEFSHGLCKECAEKLYPAFYEKKNKQR